MITIVTGVFDTGGFYNGATRVNAHPWRVGAVISPEVITVHTTDTTAGTTAAIVHSQSTTPGKGECEHFIIDRSGKFTQLISIYRNANHAGGSPRHGWFATQYDSHIHPNTIAVGIEVENGGYLGHPINGKWIHPDTKREIASSDVQVDARGVGWHKPTDVQLATLITLLTILNRTIKPMRPGLYITPNGTYKENGVPWAEVKSPRVHAHASLDPTQKTDCGPFILQRLRDEGFVT